MLNSGTCYRLSVINNCFYIVTYCNLLQVSTCLFVYWFNLKYKLIFYLTLVLEVWTCYIKKLVYTYWNEFQIAFETHAYSCQFGICHGRYCYIHISFSYTKSFVLNKCYNYTHRICSKLSVRVRLVTCHMWFR